MTDKDYNKKIYALIVFKTAKYYQMDLEIENLDNENTMLHPRIETYKRFLIQYIPINELESFYNKIIDNCQFFPTRNDLSEIYKAFTRKKEINYKAPLLTKEETALMIAERDNIDIECKEEFLKVGFEEMKKDNENLSSHQMLKKYGVKKTTSFWRELGSRKTMDEYERDLKSWRSKLEPSFQSFSVIITNPEYFQD